jgi:MFS family permease
VTSPSTATDRPAGTITHAPLHASWFRLSLPTNETSTQDVRPLLLTLGLPTFGLAFAISVLTTYGPTVLSSLGLTPAQIGALIGGEGAFALVVPLFAGALSDRLPADSPLGRRMPFVIVGAPMVGAGLVLLPFAPDYQLAGLMILIFFVGYYLYYPPYRAIYADLLPRRLQPRAQSSQAIFRGAGLGIALISGGLFLSAWTPLPFVLGGAILGVTTLALRPVLQLQRDVGNIDDDDGEVEEQIGARELFLHNRRLQIFAAANALWEFSLAGLKTFIVLYVTAGLGRSKSLASAVIAVVAVAYIVGAPIAGRAAERWGIVRVMSTAALVYGAILCAAVVPRTVTPMLILLPIGALAGAIVMTLPQALAFTLAPDSAQGAAAGLVDFSRGVGVVLGPVLVGAAISASDHFWFLKSTQGFAIMWAVIGIPNLLSLPLLRMLRPAAAPAITEV